MEASVVIPFYNAEATLTRAIYSVLTQQNVTLEILLIDNNSTDKSLAIAQSYADKYPRVTLAIESNQGANHARNLGLSLATKEWIQYLDADDKLLPLKIFNQLSLDNLSQTDVISSPITEHTIEGKIINYSVSVLDDIWLSLLQGKIGWTCSNLWRKSALLDIGGWNTDYTSHQEKELMARLIMKEKQFSFYDQSECIVYEQNKSISNRADFPMTGIKFMKFLTHYFKSNDILGPKREKVIHNQLYHKYLMAYKVNPKDAIKAMFKTSLKLDLIDIPFRHQLLISIIGLHNTFSMLKVLGRK